MNTTVIREKLSHALTVLTRISTKHQTLPVLQCVLLVSEKKKLILRATNLELSIEISLPIESGQDGIAAVPASVLLQTVELSSEKAITLTREGEVMRVLLGKSKTTIKTFPHEEFPSLQKVVGKTYTINHHLFSLGIKTAAFAASQSSIKPELGSILIQQQKEHSLTFVATDSFRLIEKTVPQKGVALEGSVLVPYRNALELARICELVGEDAELTISENQLALSFPSGVYVTTRLTEASFPDYQQIIPKEFATTATLLRGDFIHALKKTNIFTNAFLQVRLSVEPKKKTLTLSSDNGELGKTEESVSAMVEGSELALSFNQKYLTDPLTSFTDDSIVLKFAGIGRPMVIEGVSERSLRYLVMPMNR